MVDACTFLLSQAARPATPLVAENGNPKQSTHSQVVGTGRGESCDPTRDGGLRA
ncbi:hypothetical protein SCATT_01380 [Streptantibioticus cattleyicolor NRRL 8057 = DSM 46488]|uniref:Uncharacterized protein n=1 Tax=Streptantibioticus cattleyicolor (strain ATCC 35852 / DSM 46488 / JCM 4925 / NBRC 14057 / NRRL 8057) TaxID=1003195 RepID=G8X1I0_STREN|nr:hypothetical protein SCATT_01380 [Streptantibioticus cattleyicolor NRRL 8057 = DSM 46488]